MLNKQFSVPDFIEDEKQKIGFWVYEYIDFSELQKTIIRDYTSIIVNLNLVFLIISVIAWLFGWIWWFFIVIGFLYWLVLIYLFVKLIWRVKLFVALNKVIVTDRWIIAWTDVFDFDDEHFIDYLKVFEKEFDEFLFKASNLDEILNKNKQKIYEKLGWNFWYLWKWLDYVRDDDWIKFIIIVWIFTFLYSISVLFFYYFWYVFVYIFWKILIWIVKGYLTLKQNIEFKIHQKTLKIYDKLEKLKLLNELIKSKLDSFSGWEITNLWNFVEDKFSDFYAMILSVFKEKEKLYIMMEKSKYKNYIDFWKLKNFIKEKFNEPLTWMIEVLTTYIALLEKQLLELKELIKEQNKAEYIWNLKMKEQTLERQIQLMKQNKEKLEKMRM